MAQRQRQRPVPAHGMSKDRTRAGGRERLVDQRDQLARDIAFHTEMLGPGLLRRIEVEAGPLSEIIGRIVRHSFPARRSVWRDHDHAVLGRRRIRPRLGGEVVLGARQPRQPDHHRKRPLARRRPHR